MDPSIQIEWTGGEQIVFLDCLDGFYSHLHVKGKNRGYEVYFKPPGRELPTFGLKRYPYHFGTELLFANVWGC